MEQPRPPQGCFAIRADGTKVPLDLRHVGYEDGLHIWEPVEDVVSAWLPGTEYHVDMLPPFTMIRLPATYRRDAP